jgi:hypothetical protein
MATTVRADAVRWLVSKFGDKGNTVCASKLYIAEKSRTGYPAWWLEIPQRAIEAPKTGEIDLLCEVAPGANKFYYLKVPVEFLKKELPRLCVRNNGKVLSLFLSAEPDEMFVEQRGKGRIGFSRFLVTR